MYSELDTCSTPVNLNRSLPNGSNLTGIVGGLPHSEIHGSKLIRSSPWLIAAYHVLHRLCMPRHSPDALLSLDRSHRQCPPFPVPSARPNKGSAAPAGAVPVKEPAPTAEPACHEGRPDRPGRKREVTIDASLFDTANTGGVCNPFQRPAAVPSCRPGGQSPIDERPASRDEPRRRAVRQHRSWDTRPCSAPGDEPGNGTLHRQNRPSPR